MKWSRARVGGGVEGGNIAFVDGCVDVAQGLSACVGAFLDADGRVRLRLLLHFVSEANHY